MKRNAIVFGLIAGGIVSAFMVIGMAMCHGEPNYENSMYIGYAAMLVAFSFVFVGVKNYRDKYNGGVISFGKAFQLGLYITLVACTLYVVVWVIDYYCFIPDFMDKYAAHMLKSVQESGASQDKINSTIAEMDKYKAMYKNPVWVVLLTYMEILPIGLVATLLSALILKRKPKEAIVAM